MKTIAAGLERPISPSGHLSCSTHLADLNWDGELEYRRIYAVVMAKKCKGLTKGSLKVSWSFGQGLSNLVLTLESAVRLGRCRRAISMV